MLDELLMRERLRERARATEEWRHVQEALCLRRHAPVWTRHLRGYVGRWLIASGQHLAGDVK